MIPPSGRRAAATYWFRFRDIDRVYEDNGTFGLHCELEQIRIKRGFNKLMHVASSQ
jgi:hypothetical protein